MSVAYAWAQANERRDAFQRLASKHAGELIEGSFLGGSPSVRFVYEQTPVLVDTFSTGGESPTYYTQIHITWHDRKVRLEVYPEGFLNQFGKFFGMKDVEIGSPAFDRDYIISGSNFKELTEFLTPTVQAAINSLRGFMGNNDVYVAIRGGTLLIKKRGLIQNAVLLEQFLAMGLAIYDAALAGTGEGIEFVDGRQGGDALAEDIVCQICGDELGEAIVLCKSCGTPHHEDCWSYYGACSTYGCGQQRYVRPRAR